MGKWPTIGVPQNGWLIMENHIQMDDLGVPLFYGTPQMGEKKLKILEIMMGLGENIVSFHIPENDVLSFWVVPTRQTIIGWWFGTFVIFPYIEHNHPNWLSYFSDGFKPPTRIRNCGLTRTKQGLKSPTWKVKSLPCWRPWENSSCWTPLCDSSARVHTYGGFHKWGYPKMDAL